MRGHGPDPPDQDSPAESRLGYGRATIARNALWRMVDSGGQELLSMLFFIILGRLLVPADFGLVAIAGAFLLSCQLILRSGFGVAIIQRERLEPEHLDAAFWANVLLGVLLAALLAGISVPVAQGLGEPLLMPVMAALAPSLALSGASWIFHARLRREMAYHVVVWSTLASILGGGLVGVALALSDAGVWSLVGQQLSGAFFPLIVLFLCSFWRPRLRVSLSHVRDLAAFSLKVVASQSLDSASQRVVPLILAFFMSAGVVGLYVVASRLMWAFANLTMYVVWDLSLVVLSRLRSRPERHREGAYYALRITTLLCLPLFIGAVFIADPVIPLLFGEHWTESVLIFQILALFSVFFAHYRCAQQIVISAGRPDTALRLAMVSALLVPGFTVAAAPYGIVAASLAVGLAGLAPLPVAVRCLCVQVGLSARRLLAEQLPIWFAVAVMAAALAILAWFDAGDAMHPFALAGAQVLLGALAFSTTLLALAPAYAREVNDTVRSALRRPATSS